MHNHKTTSSSMIWCLGIPVVIYLSLLYLLPVYMIIWKSFTHPQVGLSNYLHVASSGALRNVGLGTLKIAILVAFGTLILGYPYAYIMTKSSSRVRNLMFVVIILSTLVSIIVRSYSWQIVLGRRGLINEFLDIFGMGPYQLTLNLTGVLIGMVHILLPYMVMPLWAVMSSIDPAYERAGLSLGASRWRVWRKVFFPLSLPGVIVGWLIVTTLSLGFYITPALLGGRKELMVSMLIEMEVNQLLRWGVAGALAAVLFLATLATYLTQRWVANRYAVRTGI